MSKEQLLALRERILNDIGPLALNGANNADHFGLLLRVIQAGNANGEVYSRAYESARLIEDKDRQLDALLALLDEIDFDATRVVQDTAESANQNEEARVPSDG